MKKDYNNYRKEKQRFSIVKVSGKTTSVLVGLTIFGGLLLDAPNAQADTTPSYEVASDTSSSTTATNSKEVTLSSTTDKANQASDQTVSSTSNESSQASATSVDNNEASSATSTTNNVATSDASTTSSDITVANNTNTTANDATNNSTTDNTVKVRTKRALPEASSTTNYDVDDIYNYYVSKGGTASKQKVQDLIDYKNNSSRVTAILNLTVDSYWVDQVLNKEVLNAQKFTDSYIDRIITTSGNSLVTTTNSKIDDQIAKLTELQQKYPNSKEVENAIEKLNETKNSVTLENVYNAEKMQDVIDTLNKYGSVSAYDDLEKAAENEQTSGSGELDNAKTDAKAAIDKLENLNEAQAAIDKLENLNDAQKAAAKEAVDNATTTAEVTNAQTSATGLDNDMLGLKNSVSDVDTTKNGENYTNASEEAKKVYDEAVSNVQAILDKAGNDATSDEVAASKKAVEDAKKALDGTTNLSNAKNEAQAAIDKLENLNDAQKAAAKEAVDNATTTAEVTNAQTSATGLDNDMSDLKNSVSDVDTTKNGENYTNASEEAKKVYDEAVANAQAILDQAGNSATSDEVAAAKKAVEDAKTGLDGTSNLSNAKADAQAAIDKLENLNDAQKAGFIADVDAASSQQLVEQAVADAKALDSEMAKLRQEVESSNQVKDTTKYANSSDTLKKNYDDLLAVATALVSKNGIDANLATVQQLVSELKAARLALNGVDTKVETNNNTNVNKAKDSLSNKATASLKTTSLPQTGETKENTSLVGAMLATIGGVLGLGLTRRKKEDK